MQYNNSVSPLIGIVYLALIIVWVVAMWKVFVKAGKPGWAAIIPFYNVFILVKIAGRPGWWFLLFLVPFLNVIISLVIAMDLAKAFGKSAIFGIILLWLFPIGYLILAFSKAQYMGTTAPAQSSTPPQMPPAQTPPQTPPPTAPQQPAA